MNKVKNILAWIGRNAPALVNFAMAVSFFAQGHYFCAFGWINAGAACVALRYLEDRLVEAHEDVLESRLAAVTFAKMFVRAKKEMPKKEEKEDENA